MADKPTMGESQKIRHRIVPYTRGRVLDLACGIAKTWPHFIGVDNYSAWNGRINHPETPPTDAFGLRMSVDVIADAFDLSLFAGCSMDAVLASHILHLAKKQVDALRGFWRVVKPGGHLILYGPYTDANEDASAIECMKANAGGWDMLESEIDRENKTFFHVYKKRSDKLQNMVWSEPKPDKTAAIVRFGAFGDNIQATSILTGLKAEGYHITFFTQPRGYEVVKHDPRIDRFILQDTDQVPSTDLGKYCDYWATRFDRFINLCETVEANLLKLPQMICAHWPQKAREMVCNADYLDLTHAVSGVDYPPDPRFYPTDKEVEWAAKERKKIPGKVLVWVSDGSSVHKFWPWMDSAIARILTMTRDWQVVIVGGDIGAILEAGWENEPRVHKKCGKWSIRETLTFAQQADLVVGPETGVMNAVAMELVPKVVFLSHSTEANLTRHWINTHPLSAKDGCRACHKLIYGWLQCSRKSKTIAVNGRDMIIEGAECQMNISVEDFWKAFEEVNQA